MKNNSINANDEAIVLYNNIIRLEKKLNKLHNEINIKKLELRQICIHNETINEENYISGSYLDRAEFITRKICKFCGKELDKQVKYGGFG